MSNNTVLYVVLGCVGAIILGVLVLAAVGFVLYTGVQSGEITLDGNSADFIKSGPYVPPTVEEDGTLFRCTRKYAQGKGRCPIEFSIQVPQGWETHDTEDAPTRNLVQFILTNEAGAEVRALAIGHVEHDEPYQSNALLNEGLMANLLGMLTPQFVSQFEASGITVEQPFSGHTEVLGKTGHRTDLILDGWTNADSPEGRYFVTLLALPRLDHKPHGVLFILMSHEDETFTSCDDLFTKGELGRCLQSFRFEN